MYNRSVFSVLIKHVETVRERVSKVHPCTMLVASLLHSARLPLKND